MKRLILFILFTASVLTSSGQTGLGINALFEGKIVPQERMVETRVRGKTLSKYQLSYFHSVRLQASEEETRQIEQLIEKDRGEQPYEETSGKGDHTILIQLPAREGQNRFLCYKRRLEKHVTAQWLETTVIYMEGRLSDFEQLKKILTNQ